MSKPSSQKGVAVPNLVIAWLTGVSGETPPPSYGAHGLPAAIQWVLWACALAAVVGVILQLGRLVFDGHSDRVGAERLVMSVVGLLVCATATAIVAALV
jgi:hypothetical protein